MTPVERLLSKLPDAKQAGKGWSARCPAHDDQRASLSIGEGADGRALVKCHAGCPAEAICAAVGLRVLDLMPTADALPTPSKPKGSDGKNGKPRIVAQYDYRDETGQLVFQVVRYEPKGFRQRRPDGKGGWTWSVQGVRVVPYRLPELLAEPARPIFIAEGEKDCDSLARVGLLATCNAGGAGKWTAEHAALTAWLQSQSGQLRELARQAREHKPNPFSFGKWYSLVWEMVMAGWDMRLLKAVQAVEDRLAYEDALRLVPDEDLKRAIVPRARSEPAQVSPSSPTLLDGAGEGRELPQGAPAPRSSPARKGEAAAVQPESKFCFHRDGDGWFVRAFGERGHFKNLKGFKYIAKLLTCPGKPVPIVELAGEESAISRRVKSDKLANTDGLTVSKRPTRQPVLDKKALKDVERKMEELKQEIEEAERHNDVARAERIRDQFEALAKQVQKDTRFDGKSRDFDSDIDSLRQSIWNAIKYAWESYKVGTCPERLITSLARSHLIR